MPCRSLRWRHRFPPLPRGKARCTEREEFGCPLAIVAFLGIHDYFVFDDFCGRAADVDYVVRDLGRCGGDEFWTGKPDSQFGPMDGVELVSGNLDRVASELRLAAQDKICDDSSYGHDGCSDGRDRAAVFGILKPIEERQKVVQTRTLSDGLCFICFNWCQQRGLLGPSLKGVGKSEFGGGLAIARGDRV